MINLFIIGNGFDLGHGIKSKYDDFKKFIKKEYPNISEDYSQLCPPINNLIKTLFVKWIESLEINVEKIKKNKIININVIGHSFSKVDMPYFEEIYKRVDKKAKWTIFYYAQDEKVLFKKKILKVGVNDKNLELKHSDSFYANN